MCGDLLQQIENTLSLIPSAPRGTDLVWAALTKYQRLGSLETTEIYFSWFWRMEVQDQGAGRVRGGRFQIQTCRIFVEEGARTSLEPLLLDINLIHEGASLVP